MYLEHVKEVSKQELFVNVSSDVVWQFIHKSPVLLGLNGIVLVILPVVFKVDFELFGHLFGKGSIAVEMSQKSKPLGEVLRVFIFSRYCLQVHQDLNELTHDVREASHTDKQDDGGNDSLDL